MTARDKYGNTYIYSAGVISEKPLDRRRLLVSYFYSENDGWSFMHNGPNRKLQVKIGRNADSCGLEEILKNKSIDNRVKKAIKHMIKNGMSSIYYQVP